MFSGKFPTDAEEQGTEEESRNPPTVGQGKKNLASLIFVFDVLFKCRDFVLFKDFASF
jgi:hypothetical protein